MLERVGFFRRNAAWFLAVVCVACGVFTTEDPLSGHSRGMVRVSSSGHGTVLGSLDAFAKAEEESPRLTASFGYDFYLDKNEVTQGGYEALMGRNPVLDAKFGKAAGLPVYNVSWYDAALYCNARSQSEGRDTVYEYGARHQDASGRVYELSGLSIRYEREGYRLPTETEWEYAARAGVSATFAWGDTLDSAAAEKTGWYAQNSNGLVHAGGTMPQNAFGLSDMLGNVMEWVNDWKGPYAAISARDFLGSREPGLVSERVVKGGAFSYDIRYLRYSGRSANYPTLSSAATEYVGFRCALGKIPSGQYLQGGGVHGGTPPVSADAAAELSFFGHRQVKLAVVNATPRTRTLCYVDFSEQPVLVHEFLDDSAVFLPVISPDGGWVAYGNVDEGDAGAGSVFIRRLGPGSGIRKLSVPSAAIPRWYVDSVLKDTFLVYATSARDNQDPSWGSDATYRAKISGGAAVGGPELVSQGGYHDGLSSDGAYLATGYRRLRVKSRSSGLERVLFTGPLNGKPTGDTSQVCNVSLSPGFVQSPHLLLLDFGYPGQSAVVGRGYGLHEILFRLDTSGNVVKWYGAPSGFVAWQDAEWSNHREYAVGVGEDGSRGYPAAVALNLKDSSMRVLARGTTLRQPGLWVKPGVMVPSALDPGVRDSMGRYNEPAGNSSLISWSAKLRVFWQNLDSAQVVCLGSSHTDRGVLPFSFFHFHVVNMGHGGGELESMSDMVRNYVLPHKSLLRAMVLEVHPGTLAVSQSYITWGPGNAGTLGYQYDLAHDFWKDGVPRMLDSIVGERIPLVTPVWDYDSRGGNGLPSSGWGVNPPPVTMLGMGSDSGRAARENLESLMGLVNAITGQGILCVLVVYPQSPRYRNTGYFGKFGPTWDLGLKIVADANTACAVKPLCKFFDEYQYGNPKYDSTDFWDADHLSAEGAIKLSGRLDSLIYDALGP